MEKSTTLDVDPKDIGRQIFEKAWYEGELTKLEIITTTEGDQFGTIGDRTLHIQARLETEEGTRFMDESARMQGPGAFVASKILTSLGATKGMDLSEFEGSKIRVEFDKPRTSEAGRTFNSLRNILLP